VRLLVYLPLLLSALAAVTARPLAARMEPRQATWLLTAATVVLAGCSMVALALLAASAAARIPLLATIGHYSQPVVRRSDPTPVVAGAVAAFLLAVAGLAVTVTVRRRARALAESYRRAARMEDDGTIVVVPGPAIEAYALPGWPGRIVISGRLLSELDDGGRAALLAHEEAHLACRHHLFATIAHLAAAANPLLLPLAHAVDYTVERWADEHAASATGDRRLVATTIAQVALLATPPQRQAVTATLGIVRAPARRISVAWAGPVPRRVAALLGPPPTPRRPLLAASAVLLAVAGASALEAARDLHSLLELASNIH
jgi:Zn-dependent protease with chaperone function